MSKKTSIASWLRNAKRGTADPQCGDCSVCCRQFKYIPLMPSDDPGQYDIDGADPCGQPALRRNADGSCVYLKNGQCSIHAARPWACRYFDCRMTAVCGLRVRGYDGEWAPTGLMGEQKTKETLTIKGPLDVAILMAIARAGSQIAKQLPEAPAEERAAFAIAYAWRQLNSGNLSEADAIKFKSEQPEQYRIAMQHLRARFGMEEE